MRAGEIHRTLLHCTERNTRYLSGCFRAVMMFDRDVFPLASTALLEAIIVMAARVKSCVESIVN